MIAIVTNYSYIKDRLSNQIVLPCSETKLWQIHLHNKNLYLINVKGNAMCTDHRWIKTIDHKLNKYATKTWTLELLYKQWFIWGLIFTMPTSIGSSSNVSRSRSIFIFFHSQANVIQARMRLLHCHFMITVDNTHTG